MPFIIDGTQEIYRETAGENGYRFRVYYQMPNIKTPASYSTVADMLSDRFVASKWTDIFYGRASAIGIDSKVIGWFDEKFKNFTEINHSSLFVNKIKFSRKDISKHSEETLGNAYLRYLNNNDNVFASIKNDPRYTSIKERLAVL